MLKSIPNSLRRTWPSALNPVWSSWPWNVCNRETPLHFGELGDPVDGEFARQSVALVGPNDAVEMNRIVGCASAPKKSVDRRWASRSSWFVFTDAMSMVASTCVCGRKRPTSSVASK